MASYLITGASRGLGLAMVEILLQQHPENVFQIIATFREESDTLKDLVKKHQDRLFLIHMNVVDEDSVRQAVKQTEEITKGGLDILVNNAQVRTSTPEGGITAMNDLTAVLNSNVNSVHLVTRAFLPLLRNGKEKKVMNISSALGSMTLARKYTNQPTPAYKISKAALNMLTVQYALEIGSKEGIIFLVVNPGWVQTEKETAAAELPVGTGAKGVLEVVHNAIADDNGKFFNIDVPTWTPRPGQNEYRGGLLPW